MINLLIDTCSLIHISEDDEHLSALENSINTKRINLFAHSLLIAEWEKNKNNIKRKRERKLLHEAKNSNDNKSQNELLPTNYQDDFYESNIERIDKILQAAQILSTPEGIKNEFVERYRNKLAPFLNGRDSQNDWEIFGTFCNYCKNYNIVEAYFISANYKDFSDLDNRDRQIHISLKERFPEINIFYFRKYIDFFNEINTAYYPAQYIEPNVYISNTKFTFESTVKSSIVESFYYLFDSLYEDLNFIPLHILAQYYPFAKSKTSAPYYSKFTLSNVNDEFVSLFNNIEIHDHTKIDFRSGIVKDQIKINKDQIEYILRRLTHNLIYNIRDKQYGSSISTYFLKENKCDCCRCTYNRFEFYKSFKATQTITNSLDEKIKMAFTNYQLGNFQTSSMLYKAIAEAAIKEKRYILYFIAKYNLKQLSISLDNPFYNSISNEPLIEELKRIDMLEEAIKLKYISDYNLLIFIAQEDYFNQAYQSIKTITNKITDHYYSQLEGGWSSNGYIWELIQEFTILERFLSSNMIIYDQYLNFFNLFEIVIEGLFASHAINEEQGQRLVNFDDYWVHKLLIYGNRKTILKYRNRYKLNKLKYISSNIDDNYFMELIENYYRECVSIDNYLNLADKSGERYFQDHYNTIFENIMTLSAILDLNENNINRIAELLLNYMQSKNKVNYSMVESITGFLNLNGAKVKEDLLLQFINYVANIEIDSNYNLALKSIIRSFNMRSFKKIPSYCFNLILDKVVSFKSNSHASTEGVLVLLFERASIHRKKIISDRVKLLLSSNFSFDLFYTATIHDIIVFDIKELLKLIDSYKVDKDRRSMKSIFTSLPDRYDNYLDSLINIIFKFNVNLSPKNIKKIKSVSPYYNWLIDMDNFNYKNFNTNWLFNHWTLYYSERMSKSNKLINVLVKYCKTHPNSKVENVLVTITYLSSLR